MYSKPQYPTTTITTENFRKLPSMKEQQVLKRTTNATTEKIVMILNLDYYQTNCEQFQREEWFLLQQLADVLTDDTGEYLEVVWIYYKKVGSCIKANAGRIP